MQAAAPKDGNIGSRNDDLVFDAVLASKTPPGEGRIGRLLKSGGQSPSRPLFTGREILRAVGQLLGMGSNSWISRLFARMRRHSRVVAVVEQQRDAPAGLPASRSCCDEDACIRKDIENLLDPDSLIEDRICVAATAVARTCGKLNPTELHFCASRLFDVPAECDLARTFMIAYQTERDALEGKRDLERRRSAGLS